MEGVRAAGPDDLATLVRLYRQAYDDMQPLRGGAMYTAREGRQPPVEGSFAADLADPRALVLVGTIDDEPLGYAVARVETLTDGTLLGVTSDLFVEADARGVGVGEALMDQVVGWLRERGCVAVDAVALPGDRATKNFFEGAGLSARLLVMHRRL